MHTLRFKNKSQKGQPMGKNTQCKQDDVICLTTTQILQRQK
jgi:hypothetical protein